MTTRFKIQNILLMIIFILFVGIIGYNGNTAIATPGSLGNTTTDTEDSEESDVFWPHDECKYLTCTYCRSEYCMYCDGPTHSCDTGCTHSQSKCPTHDSVWCSDSSCSSYADGCPECNAEPDKCPTHNTEFSTCDIHGRYCEECSPDGCPGCSDCEHNWKFTGSEYGSTGLGESILYDCYECTICGASTSEAVTEAGTVCSCCQNSLWQGECGSGCSWCSGCGNCVVHQSCTCGDSGDDSDSDSSRHTCILNGYCENTHCSNRNYCIECGHKCDGGCNKEGHCYKLHCSITTYCTKCGHSCSGHCTYTTCTKAHCGKSYCTKCEVSSPHNCGGGHISSGVWTDIGAMHVIYCGVSNCKYVVSSHSESFGAWSTEDATNHIRRCQNDSSCTIVERQNHTFNSSVLALEIGKTEHYTKHSVQCESCAERALLNHVDDDGDYRCDLCNVRLYVVIYSPSSLTNEDVVATLNVYKPGQDVETYTHTFTENGTYIFNVTEPAIDIESKVLWINKSLKGRIIYSPMMITTEPVKIYFVPDFEGYNKTIYVSANGGSEVTLNKGEKYCVTLDQNETIEFNARDSVGNKLDLTATVSWIVSSDKTTISNTYYVMQGGTMFTNILVKAEEEWSLTDVDNINITIRDKDTDEIKTGEVKTIMDVTNYYTRESLNSYETIPKGIYYIRLGIGGASIFEEGTYEVQINSIDNDSLHFAGKNKVEVEVYNLMDLT